MSAINNKVTRQIMSSIKTAILLSLAATLLAGCVTTTNQTPVNLESALDKRIQLGMKYISIDKRENARFQFSKALELDKRSAEAFHGIALVHQANGEFEPAADAFSKAMRYANDKNRSGIYVSYGKYLMDQKKTEDACEYFEKAAVDYDYKQRSEALYLSAQCAEEIGNTARVKPAYEHAINLNENYAPAMIELADIYFVEGEYAKSKKLLDRYMTVVAPTARSLWLGIRIERIFGNKDKEASYALVLKNRHPYSKEYLEYRNLKLNN